MKTLFKKLALTGLTLVAAQNTTHAMHIQTYAPQNICPFQQPIMPFINPVCPGLSTGFGAGTPVLCKNTNTNALVFNKTQEELVDTKLKNIAETNGYGYKTANLQELTELVQNTELQAKLAQLNINVNVPKFIGVSSQDVQKYFKSNSFNPAHEWTKITENTLNTQDIKNAFNNKKLPEQFLKEIEKLSTDIKNFFEKQAKAIKNPGIINRLLNYFFDTKSFQTSFIDDIRPFIEAAQKAGQKLIIRSTGMEDKKGLANAGGNESIKFIEPNITAVLRAIGEVIASYISPKSLTQRLISGDKTIFDLPAMPVLLQVMVTSNTRPLECVIHTTEQNGPTTGLTSLNCGYGVVESTQRAHLCFHFHTDHGHCILAKDVETMSPELRTALTLTAAEIEKHYQRATDIELLITHNTDSTSTINIVQARPLNRPENAKPASFVENIDLVKKQITEQNFVQAQTVVPSGSSVRNISDKKQIIIQETLKHALDTYLYNTPDKNAVTTIVVQGDAEPNSHEATTFASDGKLVMTVQNHADFEKITQWANQETPNLYLDAQLALILNPLNTEKITLKTGYISHPMPNKISIQQTPAGQPPVTLPFAIQDNMPEAGLDALITSLKQDAPEQATIALAALLARLEKLIAEQKQHISCASTPTTCYTKTIAHETLKQLEMLNNFARKCALDALSYLAKPAYDLQRLAAIKPLENLLTQEEDPALVNIFSLTSISKKFDQQKTFIEENLLKTNNSEALLTNHELIAIAQRGHTVAMTPELETKLVTFIANVAQAPKEQQLQFISLFKVLEQFELTSLWINTIFSTASGSFAEKLTAFQKDFNTAQPFLTTLKARQQEASNLAPSLWSNPDKFEKNMQNLQKIIAQITNKNFTSHITKNTNMLEIAAAISFMDTFVDQFDRSIKALKINKNVAQFKLMLQQYFNLLNAWAPLAQNWLNFNPELKLPLQEYLTTLSNILNRLDSGDKQLLPSQAFSVEAATLGSNTTFKRHLPQSAEDVFTLIHQNLLVVIGTLTNHHIAQSLAKPALFEQLEKTLLSLTPNLLLYYDQIIMKLISLSYKNNALYAHYNLPLKNHSSVFDIIYDKATNTAKLIVRFVGTRLDRWDDIQIAALEQASIESPDITLTSIVLGEQEIGLTYLITSDKNLSNLQTLLASFINIANLNQLYLNPVWNKEKILLKILKTSPDNHSQSSLFDTVSLNDESVKKHCIEFINRHFTSTNVFINNNVHKILLKLIRENHPEATDLAIKFIRQHIRNKRYITEHLETIRYITEHLETILLELLENKKIINTATQEQIDSLNGDSFQLGLRYRFIKVFPQNFSTLTNNPIGGMAQPKTPGQIKYLESKNVKLVVTLTEEPLDAKLFENTSVKNVHLPIPSGDAPTEDQVKTFLAEAKQVTSAGNKIIVHCAQGLNRTGTMLALWLMANKNMPAQQAISIVRTERPGSIGSTDQENSVYAFEKLCLEFYEKEIKTK